MKILHINNFQSPDYQNDIIYHGGKSTLLDDYESSNPALYMHQNYTNISHLYGRGFTIFGKLPPIEYKQEDLIYKIKNKYFDYIIYGSIFRDNSYFDIVFENYDKNHIIFIDGEDHQGIHSQYIEKGLYFKRELMYDETDFLKSIGFGIPDLSIQTSVIKDQIISKMNPLEKSSYIYNTEEEYYKEYNRSFFAITCKKAGWDCLRHYEILMCGCIPNFINLDQCPTNTLKHFPKNILLKYFKKYGNTISNAYFDTLSTLQNFLIENCTTKNIFKSLMERCI